MTRHDEHSNLSGNSVKCDHAEQSGFEDLQRDTRTIPHDLTYKWRTFSVTYDVFNANFL